MSKHVRRALQALFVALVCLVSGFAFTLGGLWPQPQLPVHSAMEERKDDPEAAARFEWMRLRNPATGEIPADIRRKELEFAMRLPSRESLAKTGQDAGALAVSWSARGPVNVGGRTRAMAVDVADESVILGGGVSGGMWRSTNGGASWAKASAYTSLHSVTCLVQDTRVGKQNTWYHGTGEYRGNSANGSGNAFFNGNGIFKSTDNGASWDVLPSTTTTGVNSFDQAFDYIWNLATDPSSAQDEVYAATVGGILRSTNGGASWNFVLGAFTGSHPAYTDVAATQDGVLYAALSDIKLSGTSGSLQGGIYRSTDGVTWTEITPATFPAAFDRIVLAVAPSSPDIVYFLVANANGSEGVDQVNGVQLWKYTYISGNGSGSGGAWDNRGANLPNQSGLPTNGQFDTQNCYNMLVRVKPDDPDVVVIGGTSLYVSTDGFATASQWQRVGGYVGPDTYQQTAGHHADQHAGVFLSDNKGFLSGHDGGISRTNDITGATVSWTPLNNGYSTTQFYTIALDHATDGNPQMLGGMQDNGVWLATSAAGGTPWLLQLTGDGAACAIADGRSSYYISSQNGKVYRIVLSPTGVLQDFTRIDPTGASGYLFINPFIIDPTDNRVVYIPAGSSLWRNNNVTAIPLWSVSPSTAEQTKSLNWTNLTAAGVSGTGITALAASTAGPSHRLYYGTSDGQVFRLDNAHTATAATVPVDVSTGSGFPAGAFVSGLDVDPTDADRAIVVFSNYGVASVFFTTDGGGTWSNVEGNLAGASGPSCRTARIVPFGGAAIYFLGTSVGLFSTSTLDGSSTTWVQEASSLIGNVVVGALDARPSDGTVVAATHGVGAFSGMLSTTDVASDGLPAQTALLQNFPNPFNPTTTIAYTLTERSRVTLTVFSTLGEKVTDLESGEREAGRHQVRFDARHLASGMYLYRLQVSPLERVRGRDGESGAAEYLQTRKLMVVR